MSSFLYLLQCLQSFQSTIFKWNRELNKFPHRYELHLEWQRRASLWTQACKIIPLLFIVSCASTGGKDVSTDSADASASGVRFYEKAPFILVTPDGKGGVSSKYIILPDYTRKRSISPYSILATNDTTLEFSNGMLNNAKSTGDTTIVPSAVVETAKEIALTAVKLGGLLDSADRADRETILYPPPALYRLVLLNDGATYVLRGGYGMKPGNSAERQDIFVTVLQPENNVGE